MNEKPHESNHQDVDDARLTAYALGQLDAADSAHVERWLSEVARSRAAEARETIEQIRALSTELVEAARHDSCPPPSSRLRGVIEDRLTEIAEPSPLLPGEGPGVRAVDIETASDAKTVATASPRPRSNRRRWLALAAAACLLAVVVPAALWTAFLAPHAGRNSVALKLHDGYAAPQEAADVPGLQAFESASQPAAEFPAESHMVRMGQSDESYGYAIDKEGLEKNLPKPSVAAGSSARPAEAARNRGVSDSRAGEYYQSADPWGASKQGDTAASTAPASLPASATAADDLGASRGKADQDRRAGWRGEPVVTFDNGMTGKAVEPTAPAPQSGLQDVAKKGVQPGAPARPAMERPSEDTLSTRVYPVEDLVMPAESLKQQAGGMGGMGSMGGGTAVPGSGESQQAIADNVGDQYKRYAGAAAAAATDLASERGRFGAQRGQPDPNAITSWHYSRDRRLSDEARSSTFNLDGASRFLQREESELQLGQGLDRSAPGTEQYEPIAENQFLSAAAEPLSTFSIDVDTASYANVRRFLVSGRLPPPAAVRIEEMVNYFPYDYPDPDGEHPFSVNMEVAQCPWNGDHRLVRIGLKGREIHHKERGPSNLVFLLDVSGSMSDRNKLPLVKEGMRMLVDQLGEDDRVAIVTYAGNAGLALQSTNGENKQEILQAVDALRAGGSTHGSAGIQMAYEQAAERFVDGGTNRVLLATDGDLNVGITDDDQLVQLIREKAKSGVFLTVLGFGTGNLKDAKLEKLADHGNGSYAYVDSLREAYKVLVEQATGSLVTIAKDVKIQVEFNPAEVLSYRLIGYENRMLAAEDFADDSKDAGEIGAGHTVTALYEVVPAAGSSPIEGAAASGPEASQLRYQRPTAPDLTEEAQSGELLTLHLRYKQPEGETSQLVNYTLKDAGRRFGEASDDYRFAAAVASFGMVLRGSRYAAGLGLPAVEEFAAGALGQDAEGYRREFVDLVRQTHGTLAAAGVAGNAAKSVGQPMAAEPAEPAQASQAEPADAP